MKFLNLKSIATSLLPSRHLEEILEDIVSPDAIIQVVVNHVLELGTNHIRNKWNENRNKNYVQITVWNTYDTVSRVTYNNIIEWIDENLDRNVNHYVVSGSYDSKKTSLVPQKGTIATIKKNGVSYDVWSGKEEFNTYITIRAKRKNYDDLMELYDSLRYHEPDEDMIPIYSFSVKEGSWSITNHKRKRPLNSVSLPAHVHTDLIERTINWKNNKKEYHDHYVMWKQNNLIHGPGGTGKSTLIQVLATILGFGIAKLSIQDHTDRTLLHAISTLPKNVVVAIEDGDASGAFDKRKSYTDEISKNRLNENKEEAEQDPNISDDSEIFEEGRGGVLLGSMAVSLDVILNILQGIDTPDGLFSVITSNSPNFDHAILRDGRMDTITYLGDLGPEEIKNYIKQHYPNYVIPSHIKFGNIRGSTMEDLVVRSLGNPEKFVELIVSKMR